MSQPSGTIVCHRSTYAHTLKFSYTAVLFGKSLYYSSYGVGILLNVGMCLCLYSIVFCEYVTLDIHKTYYGISTAEVNSNYIFFTHNYILG